MAVLGTSMCKMQGIRRTFDEESGVSIRSAGSEVLVPRRKLPAGLLRIEKDGKALSRGSKEAGFWE